METRTQASRSAGVLVWLRESRRPARRRAPRAVAATGRETMPGLFFRNLLHGIALVPPVAVGMMLLVAAPGGSFAGIFMAGLFISLYALVPAVTGGLLYLPPVLWAAKRWPRRARAIAVAGAPLIALGTVPWGMTGALWLWWVAIPLFAGLLCYGATIRLPSVSAAEEGGR